MAGSLREFHAVETRTSNPRFPRSSHAGTHGPNGNRTSTVAPHKGGTGRHAHRQSFKPDDFEACASNSAARAMQSSALRRKTSAAAATLICRASSKSIFACARRWFGSGDTANTPVDAFTWVSKALLNRLSPGDDWAGRAVPAENAGSLGLSRDQTPR